MLWQQFKYFGTLKFFLLEKLNTLMDFHQKFTITLHLEDLKFLSFPVSWMPPGCGVLVSAILFLFLAHTSIINTFIFRYCTCILTADTNRSNSIAGDCELASDCPNTFTPPQCKQDGASTNKCATLLSSFSGTNNSAIILSRSNKNNTWTLPCTISYSVLFLQNIIILILILESVLYSILFIGTNSTRNKIYCAHPISLFIKEQDKYSGVLWKPVFMLQSCTHNVVWEFHIFVYFKAGHVIYYGNYIPVCISELDM